MIRNISNSAIFDGCYFSLFYVKGNDRATNRYMKARMQAFMEYLRSKRIFCDKYTIVQSSFFGPYTVEKLILRQEPTLTKEELALRLAEHKKSCKAGKLIYICNRVRGGSCTIHEESIYPGDTKEKITAFLDKIALYELSYQISYLHGDNNPYRVPATYTPGPYSYRLPSGGSDEEEKESWDNSEYVAVDLLAENITERKEQVISPIKFDESYNIVLPLYPQIKIKLDPLPKALYILFLRHPEGIILKEISDYADEIRNIYCKISGRKNPSVINRLLASITNPFENTLHKNISLIRHSFLSKLHSDIAHNYIPEYCRQKAQHIPLAEDMVELPVLA